MLRRLRQNSQGFTLLELLIVIIMIGILATIVVPGLVSGRDRADIAAGKAFESSLVRNYGNNTGFLLKFDVAGSPGTDTWNAQSPFTYVPGGGHALVSDTPDQSVNAMDFDGSSTDYIRLTVPSAGTLATSTDPSGFFGFACWFKANGLPPGTSDGYILYRDGFHLGLNIRLTDGRLQGRFWSSSNTQTVLTSNVNLNDGKWHHIALTMDDREKIATLYHNGKDVVRQSYAVTLRTYGNASFNIGGHQSNPIYNANGIVDNAMFFTN